MFYTTEDKHAGKQDIRHSEGPDLETTPKRVVSHADEVHQEKEAAKYQGSAQEGDLASRWLETYNGPRGELTDKISEKIRFRIDSFLMPICFYIYMCQQIDKSSVSFAAVFGFRTDANLTGAQYSWLSSVIYVAQLVFQPLSVYALVRFPVNKWIIFCFFGWGISCMICAAFTSFPGLLVFRFILGAFEASISPSMIIIVSMWWTRREQPLRNNIWYSANGIALILGSIIAYGLAHIQGTALFTYQWIFLVSGLIAVLFAIPTMLILPAHPTTARFLSDEQKYYAIERIRLNNTGTQNTTFKWSQVRECFLDVKQWLYVLMVFCVSLVSGGISAFGPLILRGFGLDPYQTILYNMLPGAIGIVANLIAAYVVTITKRKMPVLLGICCFPVAAAAALYALPRGSQYNQSLLAVYLILQIFQPLTPVIFSWTFANTAGHTKKTTTTGMLFIGLCVGNIVGPQLYLEREQPYYPTGLTANLVVLSALFGTIIVQALYLGYLNRRNAKRRTALGKTGPNIDYSLEDSSKWAAMKAKQREQRQGETGGGEEEHNEHAFEDLTDLQNVDFVYSM